MFPSAASTRPPRSSPSPTTVRRKPLTADPPRELREHPGAGVVAEARVELAEVVGDAREHGAVSEPLQERDRLVVVRERSPIVAVEVGEDGEVLGGDGAVAGVAGPRRDVDRFEARMLGALEIAGQEHGDAEVGVRLRLLVPEPGGGRLVPILLEDPGRRLRVLLRERELSERVARLNLDDQVARGLGGSERARRAARGLVVIRALVVQLRQLRDSTSASTAASPEASAIACARERTSAASSCSPATVSSCADAVAPRPDRRASRSAPSERGPAPGDTRR